MKSNVYFKEHYKSGCYSKRLKWHQMLHKTVPEKGGLIHTFWNLCLWICGQCMSLQVLMTITSTTTDKSWLQRLILVFGISRSRSILCEIFINKLLSPDNNNLLPKLAARLTPVKRENVSSENGCTGICGGQVTNWLLTTCSVPTQFIPKPPNVQYIITHNLWVEILFDLFGHLQHQVQIWWSGYYQLSLLQFHRFN